MKGKVPPTLKFMEHLKEFNEPLQSLKTCPVCGEKLANAVMGVNSHVAMHVRRGEVAAEEKADIVKQILNRNVDYKDGNK